jgi:hypothetical protein
MTKTIKIAVMALILPLLGSCVLQSLHPFVENEDAIAVSQFNGKWILKKNLFGDLQGKKINEWEISDGEMVCYDENNVKGKLEVRFFKIDESYFADIAAASAEEKTINIYWLSCVVPVHTLAKFAISGDRLVITPANYDAINKKIESGAIKLSFVKYESNALVLTSGTAELKKFVKSIKDDVEIFNSEETIELERAAKKEDNTVSMEQK